MHTYFQHGRRHAEDGTDPIPLLVSAFATVRTDSIPGPTVTADGSQKNISLLHGTNAVFFSSDDSVFTNDFQTLSGVNIYGIKIHRPGTYILKMNGTFSGGTATNQVDIYHQGSTGDLSIFQAGRTACLLGDTWDAAAGNHIFFEEWISYDPALDGSPYIETAWAKCAAGSNPTVKIQMHMIRLHPTPDREL